VVWGWVENPYWQVFTGEIYLQTEPPIDPSSLSRWRKRMGEAGVEESVALFEHNEALRPEQSVEHT
jgi:IS5 family transposase